MVYTHHANVKCDDCGTRHQPGNEAACIETLQGFIADLESANDGFASALEAQKAVNQEVREERDAVIETIEDMHRTLEGLLADRNMFILALQSARVHVESERCWCMPEVRTVPNGNQVVIHNDPI